MDFSSRSVQPHTAVPSPQTASSGTSNITKKKGSDRGKWSRIGVVAAVVAVVILLVALIFAVSLSNKSDDEDKYVINNKLQAVFLNTGQVYFGNIKALNSQYVVLTNIYYLQTNSASGSSSSASSSSNVTLVKLGCELHAPYDQMLINRQQVTFWENLKSNGQVAQAVSTFQKDNPNGCSTSKASGSSSTNSTSTTPATTNTTPAATSTTPATTSGH